MESQFDKPHYSKECGSPLLWVKPSDVVHGVVSQYYAEWDVIVRVEERRCYSIERRKSKLYSTYQEADLVAGDFNKKIHSHHTSIAIQLNDLEKLSMEKND